MKRGRIVELRGTTHTEFLHNPAQLTVIIGQVKVFLVAPLANQ